MPSLKDLRNRIASVKATRKITKAMQMVAAAKLRRAQEAAVAARPYSERMATVLANLSSSMEGRDDAPQLLAGTGKDQTHLLVVCTAERGLCGGFNSSIAKLAREHADRLLAQGKTVKILTVGKKGNDILKRLYGRYIIDHVDLRAARTLASAMRRAIAQKVLKLFDEGEFDVCTLFFAEFKSVIAAEADGAAAHPGERRGRQSARIWAAPSMMPSPTRARSSPTSCRAISRCRFSARCSRTPPPNRARA